MLAPGAVRPWIGWGLGLNQTYIVLCHAVRKSERPPSDNSCEVVVVRGGRHPGFNRPVSLQSMARPGEQNWHSAQFQLLFISSCHTHTGRFVARLWARSHKNSVCPYFQHNTQHFFCLDWVCKQLGSSSSPRFSTVMRSSKLSATLEVQTRWPRRASNGQISQFLLIKKK